VLLNTAIDLGGSRFAGGAYAIFIKILLSRISDGWAVILRVRDAICISVDQSDGASAAALAA
jgi:hypothetical protein